MMLIAALGFVVAVLFSLYTGGTLVEIRDELRAIAEELRKDKPRG